MRVIILFILFSVFFSCNSPNKRLSPKNDFDMLENIFSTANWKITGAADTSYWYFSRLGDLNFSVYDYQILNGDSSVHEISSIHSLNNQVIWIRPADTLKLVSVDSASAQWNTLNGNKTVFIFKKLSDSSISVSLSGGRLRVMNKTLPLATFLVRIKYDYIHHAHTVDSPLVPPRGKPLR